MPAGKGAQYILNKQPVAVMRAVKGYITFYNLSPGGNAEHLYAARTDKAGVSYRAPAAELPRKFYGVSMLNSIYYADGFKKLLSYKNILN